MEIKDFVQRKYIAIGLVFAVIAVFLTILGLMGFAKTDGAAHTTSSRNECAAIEGGTNSPIEPVSIEGLPEGVHAAVLPRMELLAGVLSQTSWIKSRGPRGDGNEYFRELKDFFSNYKQHKAVQTAEKLTKLGFTYDAPPNFILSVGELPGLSLNVEYSRYLVGRARSRDTLEEFRTALSDLARESGFKEFFDSHREEYKSYLDKSVEGFRSQMVVKYMEDFFGESQSGADFHIILAPAMFPGGGYGATLTEANGKTTIYQVVREEGFGNGKPQFPSGDQLEMLTLHEWGHSFVNPALDARSDLVAKYDLVKLYKPVEEAMKKQAYGNTGTFLNEQVLRGVTTIAARDLYGETSFNDELKRQTERSFYLTEFTVGQLEFYRKNRGKYKTFKDFVPYLLEQYSKNMDTLLKQVR